MATQERSWRGTLSETERVQAVKRFFADRGVPVRKLGFVDSFRGEKKRYPFVNCDITDVYVWERPADMSEDLSSDEFSAYMSALNELVSGHPRNRFENDEETRCAIKHDFIDSELMSQNTQNPADAGNDLAEPPENMNGRYSVFHHGGNRFTVYDEHADTPRAYRVDMDRSPTEEPVETLFSGQPEPESSEARDVIGAVVRAGPSYREGPQEQLSVTVESPGAGNASGSGQSAGTGGSDTNDSGDKWSKGEFDGSTDQATQINEWLDNYANVKSDLDTDAIDVDAGEWDGREGFKLEANPFDAGYYEGDDWADKEGFEAHKEAFRDIMQGEDEIEYYGDPDYVNFLPADAVDEVTG